jgi:hypothetical protein
MTVHWLVGETNAGWWTVYIPAFAKSAKDAAPALNDREADFSAPPFTM